MTTVTEGIREKAERLWRRRSGASWLEMQEKSAQHSGVWGRLRGVAAVGTLEDTTATVACTQGVRAVAHVMCLQLACTAER